MFPHLIIITDSGLLLQEAVVDSLGISTVLEGCRQLTKVAFTQLDIAESVFERMARQTSQLQVCYRKGYIFCVRMYKCEAMVRCSVLAKPPCTVTRVTM